MTPCVGCCGNRSPRLPLLHFRRAAWLLVHEEHARVVDAVLHQGVLQRWLLFPIWYFCIVPHCCVDVLEFVVVQVSNEAPSDMRSNLSRSWAYFSQEMIDSCSKPTEFKTCLLTLCFYHSIVLGRKKFGQQGWSKRYSFNQGDLTVCADVLLKVRNAPLATFGCRLLADDFFWCLRCTIIIFLVFVLHGLCLAVHQQQRARALGGHALRVRPNHVRRPYHGCVGSSLQQHVPGCVHATEHSARLRACTGLQGAWSLCFHGASWPCQCCCCLNLRSRASTACPTLAGTGYLGHELRRRHELLPDGAPQRVAANVWSAPQR